MTGEVLDCLAGDDAHLAQQLRRVPGLRVAVHDGVQLASDEHFGAVVCWQEGHKEAGVADALAVVGRDRHRGPVGSLAQQSGKVLGITVHAGIDDLGAERPQHPGDDELAIHVGVGRPDDERLPRITSAIPAERMRSTSDRMISLERLVNSVGLNGTTPLGSASSR